MARQSRFAAKTVAATTAFAFLLSVVGVALEGCSSNSADYKQHIRHVIVVIQENRSFDNLFRGFPGADSAGSGKIHTGSTVRLQPISLTAAFDISHTRAEFMKSYDGGKMDGFDLAHAGSLPGGYGRTPKGLRNPQYAYVPEAEIRPYWQLASRYGLADELFQSNFDESFGAHLYLISGQAGGATNVPNSHPWGCDSAPWSTVLTFLPNGKPGKRVFPCFSFRTLASELDAHAVPWAYYAPRVVAWQNWRRAERAQRRAHGKAKRRIEIGQLWSAFDAIAPVRYGPDWDNHVVSPETTIFSDIRSGNLPAVSWVAPDFRNSDHPMSRSVNGPKWVAAITDAIGKSAYWNDTVVVVLWDDSGGWYDHVPPPRLDAYGSGCRVPMIVVSRYSKEHYISHETREFGSILKLIEETFDLQPLTDRDAHADDLRDFFDFVQAPRTYVPILKPEEAAQIQKSRPSGIAPDTE